MRRCIIYDFIDRPVTSLDRGGRLLVGGMRHWARAVQARRCPCGNLRPIFESADLADAIPHFHAMMAVLNRHAVMKMGVGDHHCARVSEHEALVIAMVHMTGRPQVHTADPIRGRNEPSRAAGTAALIVGARHAARLLAPMAALAKALAVANRFPNAPIHDPDCTRFPR